MILLISFGVGRDCNYLVQDELFSVSRNSLQILLLRVKYAPPPLSIQALADEVYCLPSDSASTIRYSFRVHIAGLDSKSVFRFANESVQ